MVHESLRSAAIRLSIFDADKEEMTIEDFGMTPPPLIQFVGLAE
jgi:hypothetical protein